MVAADYTLTKGRAVASNGDVFFTDSPNDRPFLNVVEQDKSVSVIYGTQEVQRTLFWTTKEIYCPVPMIKITWAYCQIPKKM